MDQTNCYADILTEVFRAEVGTPFSAQPRLQVVAACDRAAGEFLLILLGWASETEWRDTVLVHARLLNNFVVIETDNLETGLKPALIAAGIPAEHILSGLQYERLKARNAQDPATSAEALAA